MAGGEELAFNKRAEMASAQEVLDNGREGSFLRRPFAPEWGVTPWVKWATVTYAFGQLGVVPPASVLDVGCGSGWTSVFLAEAGFHPLGVDIAAAALEMGRQRAARWDVPARFQAADMDALDVGETFDHALVYDALHHSEQTQAVIAGIYRHLRPGGWLLIGEPSWLHLLSPHNRAERAAGWIEKGFTVRTLRKACRAAGFGETRRFFEGTQPYHRRLVQFGDRAVRLGAANVACAPQTSLWLAARKKG